MCALCMYGMYIVYADECVSAHAYINVYREHGGALNVFYFSSLNCLKTSFVREPEPGILAGQASELLRFCFLIHPPPDLGL